MKKNGGKTEIAAAGLQAFLSRKEHELMGVSGASFVGFGTYGSASASRMLILLATNCAFIR